MCLPEPLAGERQRSRPPRRIIYTDRGDGAQPRTLIVHLLRNVFMENHSILIMNSASALYTPLWAAAGYGRTSCRKLKKTLLIAEQLHTLQSRP